MENYKRKIIKLVQIINDEKFLMRIYVSLRDYVKEILD